MSKVGDVVFCVDCDLARSAYGNGASAAPDGKTEQHPRRMATKKDPNGDALCAACLDARLKRRRAEFQLRQVAQAPATPAPTVRPQIVHAPVRKLSEVRITRVRPAAEAESTANGSGNGNGIRSGIGNGIRNGIGNGNGSADKHVAPSFRGIAPALRGGASFDRDRELRFIAKHVAKAPDRKLERAFLELSASIGFLRAQELLGKLRSRAQAITGRPR